MTQIVFTAVVLVLAGWGVYDGQAWLERRDYKRHSKD